MNKLVYVCSAVGTLGILALANPSRVEDMGPLHPRSAQSRLELGHSRFMNGKPTHPNLEVARIRETSKGQKPYATILTCSDSRVPAELIFDQGIGDLFIVRVAGNVVGPSEMATIEYGVGHLKTPLVIVMGHTKCGAVAAAAAGAEVHGQLPALLGRIQPAVIRARKLTDESSEVAQLAVRENVWVQTEHLLKHSKEVRQAVSTGEVRVIGAIYDVHSGTVDWLGEHAQLASLLKADAPKSASTEGKETKTEGQAKVGH